MADKAIEIRGDAHHLVLFCKTVEGHEAYVLWQPNKEPKTFCSCNASWTHPASASVDDIASIFSSHLDYFNRPKMETL